VVELWTVPAVALADNCPTSFFWTCLLKPRLDRAAPATPEIIFPTG
jgi:hypothetical protein